MDESPESAILARQARAASITGENVNIEEAIRLAKAAKSANIENAVEDTVNRNKNKKTQRNSH